MVSLKQKNPSLMKDSFNLEYLLANLVVCGLYLVQRLFKYRSRTAKIHTHISRAFFSEHGSVVHTNFCFAYKELDQFIVWQSQATRIQKYKERCLWTNHTHLWHILLVFLDARGLGLPHDKLVEFFIREAKVGMNDGAMFGEEGSGFMRMNLGCPRSVVEKALKQIKAAYDKIA